MRLKEEERAFQMSDIHFKLRKSSKRIIVASPMSSRGFAFLKSHDMEDSPAYSAEVAREIYRAAHELGLRISFASRELMDEIASVTL